MEWAPRRAQAWKWTGRATGMLELYFMVKHQRVEKLYETATRVSDPRSKDYGRHLSLEEVQRLVEPRAEDVAAVLEFLEGANASVIHGRSIITAIVPVEVAEGLLGTTYERLEHSGRIANRILTNYSLPRKVAAAVDFVAPTVHIPGGGGRRGVVNKKMNVEANVKNEPKSLRTLYNMSLDTVGQVSENSMAVTAFLEQYYSRADLEKYWETYCDGIVCGQGLPELVGDATAGTPAGIESMLDIETVTGVAGNIKASFWGFAGRSPDNIENEPFMKWLATVGNWSSPPLIFSTSYGEDESSWTEPAADRLNQEFAKVATRGISLLFASGDEGANCEDGNVYAPETPASSPWVTAVGGTTQRPEIAVGLSTGGFSNYWGVADYQTDAVSKFLASYYAAGIAFNSSGRAFPDISAQATDFCVTPFGCTIGGTSCASPTAAGIFALLNDLRLQAGKPALGFLNYFIYQHASYFNDITDGAATGCTLLEQGWPALPGWDPVTGVGTPNYGRLRDAVLDLP